MSILRTVYCDVPGCLSQAIELAPNTGWTGWGQLLGVKIDNVENPVLCPKCLGQAAEFIATSLAKEE